MKSTLLILAFLFSNLYGFAQSLIALEAETATPAEKSSIVKPSMAAADYKTLVKDYNLALAEKPNDLTIINNRAKAFVGLKNYKLAIADYSRILEYDVEN